MSIASENLPLPRRDDNKKKRAATRWNLNISYRAAAAPHLKKNLPLPRWYSEKCFDFQGCD
jgi:hypothetical protein